MTQSQLDTVFKKFGREIDFDMGVFLPLQPNAKGIIQMVPILPHFPMAMGAEQLGQIKAAGGRIIKNYYPAFGAIIMGRQRIDRRNS